LTLFTQQFRATCLFYKSGSARDSSAPQTNLNIYVPVIRHAKTFRTW